MKREAEETELRAIFASSPDAITTSDLNGNITDCNQATLYLHGYSSKEELIGKSASELIAKKDHKRAIENLKKTLEQGSVRNIEYTFLAKDGREFPAELSASVVKDSSGNPTGFVAVTKDITERKKAEEELRETKNYLDNLLNYANAPIIVWDNKKRITLFNNAFEAFTGYKKESMLGRNIDVLFPPLQKEEILQTIEKATKGEKWKSVETPILCKDKETKIALWNSANITDKEGRIIATIAQGQDVTERKRMEEKLSESEEKFRNLYESIQDPMVVYVGKEGHLIEYNEAFKKQTGYTDEELKDKTFLDFVHPDDQAMVLEKYRTRYPEEKLPLVYEIRVLNKKGETIPLEISVSQYKVKGKVVGIESIGRDITERKKAEKRISESEEKYRNLFENARDVIITFDLKGNMTNVNKAVAKYGFKKDEMLGKSMLKFVSEKYWPRLLKELAKIARGTSMEGEIEIITPNGKKIAEYRSNPIRLGKKVVGFQTIMRDITERKKMEKKLQEYAEHLEEKVEERTRELRKSEERYSSIVNDAIDSLESGILILDKDFKVVWINKAIEKFFGLNRDSLIGVDKRKAIKEKIKYFFEDPGRFEKTVLATYNDNTYVENFECHVLLSRDKEERFLVHWSTPIKIGAYAGGRIEHYYDVTKLKQMEEHLLKSERMAAIGEVATMVGHDLRNPLQSIENATYYLNNELPRLPPSTPILQKTLEMLRVINDSVNYADRIIRDLHDFAADKKPILKKTNINAIVKEALSQVKAPENVKLITELGHIPEIKADKDMIKRVFMNLAVNGTQAMKKGGTLKVSTKKTKGFVEVSFKDTGTGISKQNMKKIFTPFFTTRAKGMGMGLPVCKKFVEIHSGSIHVESEEVKGSTFTVKLPVK